MSSLLKILSIIAQVWKFFFDRSHSPSGQYEEAKSDNAKAVTGGDANYINAALDRNLDRLRDDQPGSGNSI